MAAVIPARVVRKMETTKLSAPTASPESSDDSLALQFAEQHADDRLYVAAWSRWLTWDEVRWFRDDTLKIFDDARSICRVAAVRCNDPKQGKLLASAATVAAVERLARSDRRLAASQSQFDADPWAFNTPGGLIDLRTGEVRPARRDDFVTRMAAARLGGGRRRWLEFLKRVTDGDDGLQKFLCRVAGYCLTGLTREHALFFLFGLGGNGKSIFSETLSRVMGDYAIAAPVEMFVSSKFQTHTTDVAGLQGARVVTASETDAGRSLAEARIKLLTGGETVSARRMRADNTAFIPQFKLIMSGNHKPRINSSDEAIRRRLHLIPFSVTIPPWERDPKLPERLAEEFGGILEWALEGCLDWQRQGLAPPATVRNATDQYLDAEDVVRSWLTEAIEFDGSSRSSTENLFASWSRFATEAREDVGGSKEFVKALEAKGIERRHTREGNRWVGVRVREKSQ